MSPSVAEPPRAGLYLNLDALPSAATARQKDRQNR